MEGLAVLKKCAKIQNVVSSSDFEIFSPEIHALRNCPKLFAQFFPSASVEKVT